MATTDVGSSSRSVVSGSTDVSGRDDSANEGGPSKSTSSQAASEVLNKESQDGSSSSSRKSFVVEEYQRDDIPESCCQKIGNCFRTFFS